MREDNSFDVIIVGGSYAGLSAGMALGRSLRHVLIMDSGLPCNRQTPHSHNFLTHDGKIPKEIADLAREQVLNYETVQLYNESAVKGEKTDSGFKIAAQTGEVFHAKKLIFATGVRDIMPDIEGFSECWGISVVHCPYCHGYEIKNEITGILDNGDSAIHYACLVRNLTDKLSIYTNGKPTFTDDQVRTLKKHNINVFEEEIERIVQTNGIIEVIAFKDGSVAPISALYAKVSFEQHSDIPASLGCELSDKGLISVNESQQTTIPGVFACGDSITFMRSVANAVATGNFVGGIVNKELCEEEF